MSKSEAFDLSMLTAALAPGQPAVLLSCEPDNMEGGHPDGLRPTKKGDLRTIHVEPESLLHGPEALGATLDNYEIPTEGVVLLVPPFGRTTQLAGRFDASELASRNLVRCISPKLDVALALPRHVLNRRTGSMLTKIAKGRHVRAVIELPGKLLMPSLSSDLELFVVYLTHEVADRAAFVKLGPGGMAEVAKEVTDLWGGRPTADGGFGLDRSDFELADGILPIKLDPRRLRRVNEATTIGVLHRIGDLCEVFLGRARRVQRDERRPKDGVPILTGSHVRSGVILADDQSNLVEPTAKDALATGDVVLGAISNADGLFVAAQVEDDDLPLVAAHSVLVIRPLPGMTGAERRVLRYFVESSRFASQLTSSRLGSRLRVLPHEVADARFPMPDTDFSDALLAVESASVDFEEWRNESLQQLKLSFDAEDLVASRAQLIRDSNLLRQRAAAGRQLDDLEHRVATQYPLPVAYRLRRAVAARGGTDELTAVLHAQEVLLAYLAAMALTFARESNLPIGRLKGISSRLTEGESGLGLGQWKEILDEVAEARVFKKIPPGAPLVDVRSYFQNPNTKEAAERLAERRNFVAHLREFAPGEGTIKCNEAWADLRTLLAAAEFVTEYPLMRITGTVWNDIDEETTICFRSLIGDNPVVPNNERVIPGGGIESGSLYLNDARGDLHLLRPLMIGSDCPVCGHWSTFLVDRYRSDIGVVEYKSLEHGHPLDGPEASASHLAHVGLLHDSVAMGGDDGLAPDSNKLQLDVDGIRAEGQIGADGFVVFAGSRARPTLEPTGPIQAVELRGTLIERGVLVDEGTFWRFTEDCVFESSSIAASVLLGPTGLRPPAWHKASESILLDPGPPEPETGEVM